MSEMRRLLEAAERSNRREDYASSRIRILRSLDGPLRQQLSEDGLSLNELIEIVAQGYLGKHPAVLAMIDDAIRRKARPESRRSTLSRRELDEIYAELGSGMMAEED